MDDNKFVYVALDYNSQQRNFDFAKCLVESVNSDRFGHKVNLDSIADFSPTALNPYSFIKSIKNLGKPVFIDFKMWNGGRTMENIAQGCADLEVDIINMYPHVGGKFMERVVSTLSGSQTKLFGLTVLTHYNDLDTIKLYGKNLQDSVRMLAEMNYNSGASGIVVPGTQLDVVRDLPLKKLCAGIRPTWFEDRKVNDQEQTVTPYQALNNGADYIVIGSPIRKSKNPSKALERVIQEIT